MRLIFPEQPGRQIAGLAIGGFLPCMLYLHLYPANEPLVAMLSSAAILTALHSLRRSEPGLVIHALLGLFLGLALLAKVSALLLLPPILGALIVRAVRGDPRGRPRRVFAVGSAVGLWALTSFATYWIDASSAKARLVKGAIEADGGDRALGLALMREALGSDPGDWSSRVLLAGYVLQAGGPHAEVVQLLAPDAQVPGLAARHVALAMLAIREGDAPRAQAALRRAVALDPDGVQAHHQLAALAAAAGDLEGAVRELREVLRIDPQHHPSHMALSDLYRRLGDVRSAAMHQAWAARLEPGT